MTDSRGRPLLWLFLAAVVVLGAGLGMRGPWPPDEPRFALIAEDMAESGNWLIPRVGGVLYPDKPPLFFWAVGGFYALTGSIAVAFLLPSLLAGLGVLWLVYDLARRLWNAEVAAWTGAALLATVQFPLQMKSGQIDGLLCFWTTLGLYGLSRHLLLGPDWRWLALGGAACGAGVITKGVGFLPFLILLPWLYARLRAWPVSRIRSSNGRWLLAPAAFLLVIGLWLVPMLLVTSGSADPDLAQYRDNILFRQTVTRYAEAWGHLKPPRYLLTNAVSWLWLPFTALVPWLVPAWMRDLKARDPATLLLGAWVLLVLLFFSLSAGKRSVYILPALPALALISGRHLPELLARPGPRRMLYGVALLLAVLVLAAGAYTLIEPQALRHWLADSAQAQPLSWTVIGMGLVAVVLTLWFRTRRAAIGYAATLATLWLGVSLFVYPLMDATRSGRGIVESAAAVLEPGDSLGFAGWKAQFLLQWDRPAVHFGYRRRDDAVESRDAAAWLSRAGNRRLLLPRGMLEPCFDPSRVAVLGLAHRKYWVIAQPSSVLPACAAPPGTATDNIVRYEPEGP
jgi:4-amino-4-deoxy-L-arabinose transferase-like glycosyltransferase